ncbi:HNH endonuclease [Mesorhizobium sp. B2-7-3]|uniref:HNH endonuclease n=1 Tax=Mesorhizobium sp. B2-7-3 TaxID=2589907 RepID=UPI00112BACEE|nr:HNH endonuclease [Mesorhizobium sp. B2-7-3]TPJ13724.1 HNH endonuclease [Mesorhizobium sp. B2-7-3]
MDDAYTPTLEDFAFTDSEMEVITAALETEKPWDWKAGDERDETVKIIKKKIETFHLGRHKDQCCYCRRHLGGAGYFMIDREHVLPKSVGAFRLLSFEIWNLGVSCKRCNMQYKKERIDFVIDQADEGARKSSHNYRLIHPNFDNYEKHFDHYMLQKNGVTLQKFTRLEGSAKAEYTYDFFNLRGLEVGSFDEAQGVAQQHQGLGKGALEARSLAEDFGQ